MRSATGSDNARAPLPDALSYLLRLEPGQNQLQDVGFQQADYNEDFAGLGEERRQFFQLA